MATGAGTGAGSGIGQAAAIARFRPHAVAVEGLFSFRNARSALVLGHARGVALLVAARAGLSG